MSNREEQLTIDGIVDRVRALAPFIAENAERAEHDRKPVDTVMTALESTGVFRAFVPKRFGGFEIEPDTFIDIGIAVSEACTSTGWVTTFYMEHNWMLSQFPRETQEKVFGQQPYILAPATIAPTGGATAAPPPQAGHHLSGRWAWGTGVMHADWVLLSGIVPGNPPDVRLFLVPRNEIAIEETWNASGMQGTGSNDMIAEGVFVPTERSEDMLAMSVGRGSGSVWHASPCYRIPMLPLLCIAAAIPALGAARRAVDLFQERLGGRLVFGTMTKHAERASAQMRLAHAITRVDEAETLLRAVGRRLARWGHEEETCPPLERARLRLQTAHVVEMCRSIVRDVMEASGASAQLRPHPMQRIHRDIHTLSCHTVFDLDFGAENFGRLVLGLDPIGPT